MKEKKSERKIQIIGEMYLSQFFVER